MIEEREEYFWEFLDLRVIYERCKVDCQKLK